jgi:beta-galactosidase
MYFGAAWYPEHWPEARWPEDLRLMREAGMNVVRLAEFAWSRLEPTEGQYAFGWLERAIALAHEQGFAIVLGTPTAAPPAWLTFHHPDTLAVEPNGRPAQHGNRCHASPNSVTYQKYCRRIVEQMAKRFGPDPRILGWQIDNEYNRVDYSDAARRQFQAFLREQYGSLEALNRHWSTVYWSQTYTEWNEIPIPIGPHNPGLMLAFRRFVTHTWREFQRLQIETLRLYTRPEQWITHNFMGWYDAYDHYEIAADLDFVSWDWYVGTGHNDYTRSGAAHDLTRGFKRKNFWVMETQPGNVNWAAINTTLNRGEARAMAWHAVAHGAESLLYWQWRSAPGGQEQLHGTLIGADGRPRPFYEEAAQIGREFRLAAGILRETQPKNQVAILHSYDARWALQDQRHHQQFDPVEHLLHYYRPLAERNVGVDILSAEAALDGYRLVIASALVMLSDTTASHLRAFVEDGGALVLTIRCGQKDMHSALLPDLQPGPLREIAGLEVEEFYALLEPIPITVCWNGLEAPQTGECRLWAERLRPLSSQAEVLARFGPSNGWLDGHPAMLRHPVGERGGQVITIGATLEDTLQADLTDWLLNQSGVTPTIAGAPPGVEAAYRVAEDGRRVLLVINHDRMEATLPLEHPVTDALTGERYVETLPLTPYGVRVCVGVS